MGHGARAFLAASLGFAAAFVVACGGGNGLLSGDQASALKSQLASISSAVDAGRCARADAAARHFNDLVGELPRNVDTTLIKNLGQGAETVSELVADHCTNAPVTTTSSSSTTTSTTATSTETTTVTQTTTPPPTSTSSSTSTSTSTATNPTGTGTTSNGGAGITTGQGGGGAIQNG
jgi:hypothetical protein